MVFPLYTRTNRTRDHHLLWPLVKISEGRLTRLAPLYFAAHEDEFTLFPLIRQTQDYVVWSVPPVYVDRHEKFWTLFPLYLRNDDLHVAFPNLYFENGPDGVRRLGSFGIFDYAREGDDLAVHTLFGIAGVGFGGDTSWSYLAPFYARREDPELEELFILPYYSARGVERDTTVFFPFYLRNDTADEHLLQIGPYYESRSARHETAGVFPFYEVGEARASGRKQHSLSVLWPLYERNEVVDEQGTLLRRQRRFLLFSDALDEDGNRTLRILGIPVMERTRS